MGRRTAEGKSKPEIIRCLKHYVAREIFSHLCRAPEQQPASSKWPLDLYRSINARRRPSSAAKAATGVTPDRVTTDGHGSYPRAIRSTLGRRFLHRTSAFRNNGFEQDHRGIKGRIRCMRGFKSFASAQCFCRSHDELRDFLRPRRHHNQHAPANRRRRLHLRRATAALAILVAA